MSEIDARHLAEHLATLLNESFGAQGRFVFLWDRADLPQFLPTPCNEWSQ